jgi:Ca2+-binding RTX toxin-like protein
VAVSPLGTITIDASGSTGIDFEAFIMGGFLDGTTLIPPPMFDNSMSFGGEEVFYKYGNAPTDKYVLAHGSFAYSLETHQVTGEINRIEFGTRGAGTFDGNGYYVGGDVQLSITGLEITDPAVIQAISAIFYDGGDYELEDLEVLWETLGGYSQNFIGTSGADTYAGSGFDDRIAAGGGDDMIDGGGGVDTAVFTGNRTDYTVIDNGDGTWTVTDNRGPGLDGEDTLTGVERVEFADETIGISPPTATDDSATTLKSSRWIVNVLGNDTELDGTLVSSTVAVVTGPAHGTFAINTTTGAITYTPTAGYVGADSFTYSVKDDDGLTSNEATVTINVVETFELTGGDDVFSGDSLGWTAAPIVVDGGAGHDYIVTSNIGNQPDTIYGVDGNDLIFTGRGNDHVEGGDGDDVIHARAGDDTVIGGDGDDTFVIRFTDAGTTTITDDDRVLFHGTFRPAPFPSSWSPAPSATSGYLIEGEATFVSDGLWNLLVNGGADTLTLAWTGGDLTITKPGGAQTVVIKDYVRGTFGIELENSPPTDLELSGTTDLDGTPTVFVKEDAAVGAVIGTVSADDLEGDDLTFEVDGAAADFFEVVGTELRVKAALDHETATSHVVTVKVTDEAGNFITRDFTVEVRDVLEQPEGTLTIDASALENVNLSTFLADYFAGAGTGTATLSGGVPTETGDQIDIDFSGGDQLVTINGAFTDDEEAHGGDYGDGISGSLDSVMLGYDGGPGIDLSGFGIEAAAGSGSSSDNLLNRFYAALLAGDVAAIRAILASYAQNFTGTTGSDQFVGSKFDDIIDGNGGLDFLIGGQGDDLYIVGDSDSVLVEKTGEGDDSVQSTVSFELWSNVENLELLGSDNIDATGNELANILLGNSGNNRLDGKAGADTMEGGDGDDTYVVDNIGDTVSEDGSLGTDTVESSVTFALGANIENIILTGSAAISAIGNGDANELTGNDAANTLNGGAGGDTMEGLGGNDIYIVDNLLDTVVEAAGKGTDTVRSTLQDSVLAANVENLVMLGTANLRASGNELRNVMTGNRGANTLNGLAQNDTLSGGAGNDRLNGGLGQDRLTGGANNDTFVFDVALTAANRDTITDFNVVNDRIHLERDIFKKAGALGVLKAAAFVLGPKAADASDRIIYNKASGALFYDADGSGAGAQVMFATLANKPAISHLDFFIV